MNLYLRQVLHSTVHLYAKRWEVLKKKTKKHKITKKTIKSQLGKSIQ
jgi:hypothetical protein